jgi:hypothetical protein
MALPPELRLNVYENVQEIVITRLPVLGVDIFSPDLDLNLLRTSHQINRESSSILRHSRLKLSPTIILHMDDEKSRMSNTTLFLVSHLIEAIIDGAFMSESKWPACTQNMAFICESQLDTFAMWLCSHLSVSGEMEEPYSEDVVLDAHFMRGYFHRMILQLRTHKTLAIRIVLGNGGVARFELLEFACCFWASFADVLENSLIVSNGLRLRVVIIVQLGKADDTRATMNRAWACSQIGRLDIEYTIEEVAGELNMLS